jgi:hypothetical protein
MDIYRNLKLRKRELADQLTSKLDMLKEICIREGVGVEILWDFFLIF